MGIDYDSGVVFGWGELNGARVIAYLIEQQIGSCGGTYKSKDGKTVLVPGDDYAFPTTAVTKKAKHDKKFDNFSLGGLIFGRASQCFCGVDCCWKYDVLPKGIKIVRANRLEMDLGNSEEEETHGEFMVGIDIKGPITRAKLNAIPEETIATARELARKLSYQGTAYEKMEEEPHILSYYNVS